MSKGTKATAHAVIDGSNLATEGRKEPSLAQLDEAVRAIDAEYDFAQITVIVDATFEHRVAKAETKAARSAIDDGDILTPPAGVIGRGDAFILQVADRADAVVFSNDSFQEFHGIYDWLFDEGRLIGGKPVPGVGWIYVARSPVRGPVSRRATADSRRSASKAKAEPKETTSRRSSGRSSASKGSDNKTSDNKSAGRKGSDSKGSDSKGSDSKGAESKEEPKRSRRSRKSTSGRSKSDSSGDGSNDPEVWEAFKADFPVGSTIATEVDRFSSHGAYGSVDDVVVYLPNRLLGDPAPTKARDVIELGETVDFVVHRYDDERNGIDAGLIPVPGQSQGRRRPAKKAAAKPAATARKAPAKKATAKKTTSRSTARKAPAKKATAKKTTAKKTTSRSTAKKTTAKKATAKKTTAKKTPAKRTAKKATKKATKRR